MESTAQPIRSIEQRLAKNFPYPRRRSSLQIGGMQTLARAYARAFNLQTSNRNANFDAFDHLARALLAQLQIQAALYNREKNAIAARLRGNTTIEPARSLRVFS